MNINGTRVKKIVKIWNFTEVISPRKNEQFFLYQLIIAASEIFVSVQQKKIKVR